MSTKPDPKFVKEMQDILLEQYKNRPLKRFLVFAGDNYYPAGGWQDFKDSFATLEEAKAAAGKLCGKTNDGAFMSTGCDWAHIVDSFHPEQEPIDALVPHALNPRRTP